MAKVRIGIVGVGGRGIHSFGHGFINDQADRAQIVAMADPNLDRATAGMEWLGIQCDLHESAEDLCKRKDIDAVVITTPDYLHEECAVMAFKHGKHVLVDKPLATTVDGCLKVIDASKRAKKLLYMGFNLRHAILIRKFKSMIDQGVFGEIFSMQAIEHYKGGRSYHSRWNRLKKYSGGLWLHKGSHDFDVLNYFMGDVRPKQVSCFANVFTFKPERLPFKTRKGVDVGPTCSECAYQEICPDAVDYMDESTNLHATAKMFNAETAKTDGYRKDICMYTSEKDTHDQGIAIVEYENGATASHSEYFATPLTMRRYLIEGTEGHGESGFERAVNFFPRWNGEKITHNLPEETGGHGGADPIMVREFLDCIQKRKRPTAGGIDGTWAVAVSVACEISREQNRVVEISELLNPKSKLLK